MLGLFDAANDGVFPSAASSQSGGPVGVEPIHGRLVARVLALGLQLLGQHWCLCQVLPLGHLTSGNLRSADDFQGARHCRMGQRSRADIAHRWLWA